MKNLFKIFLLSLCILIIFNPVINAANGSELSDINENYQIQPTASVEAYTYFVLIWTDISLLPEYFDLFEFEAGDSFKVYSRKGEWEGSWHEAPLTPKFSFFQAQVEEIETTTTTTASSSAQKHIAYKLAGADDTDFLVNLSGISTEIEIPSPFLIGLSTILGNGLYLGHEGVFFMGFAAITKVEEFVSIVPDSAYQGDKNVSAEILCRNTSFMEKEIDIDFSGTGVTAKDIQILSNTKLKFKIDVDVDAEVGKSNVTVDYEDGVVTGEDEFEVLKRQETTTSTTTTTTP